MPRPTGSTVKLLTALVAVRDPALVPDRVITVSAAQARAAAFGYAQGNSELSLTPGERLTIHDLLLALLLPSGDDAADLLAAHSTGGTAVFLRRMGTLAAKLRLGPTQFGDPSGLSAQDRITPAGAIRLALAALADPRVADIVRLRTARLSNGQVVKNLNRLLWTYPGAIGMKTGSTVPAGYVLIFASRRKGALAIGSVMHEQGFPQTFRDAAAILDYAFQAGATRTLPAGTAVAVVHWPFGLRQTVRLASPLFLGPPGAAAPRVLLANARAIAWGGSVGSIRAGGRSSALRTSALPPWLQLWLGL